MRFELVSPQVAVYSAVNGYIVVVGPRQGDRRWLADFVAGILRALPNLPVQIKTMLESAMSGVPDGTELTDKGVQPIKGSPGQLAEEFSDNVNRTLLPVMQQLKTGSPRVFVCNSEVELLAFMAGLYGQAEMWDSAMELLADAQAGEDDTFTKPGDEAPK